MEIIEAGSGPAVVLLHGCPSPVSYFAPVIEALSPKRRVLCPVVPGYGPSAPHPGGYRLAEMTRLLCHELAARGVTEAAVLGYSFGGYRAIALALSGQFRVTSLYLLSAVAGFDEGERRERAGLAAVCRDPSVDVHRLFVQMVLPPAYAEAHPAEAAVIASWVDLAPLEVIAAEVDASVIDEDLRPRLRELDMPLVARVGALDAAALPRRSEDIVSRAAHATLEVVPGCGHALLIEDREATTASVTRFFLS